MDGEAASSEDLVAEDQVLDLETDRDGGRLERPDA